MFRANLYARFRHTKEEKNWKKDTSAIKSPRDKRTERKFCWIEETSYPRQAFFKFKIRNGV